MHEISLKNAYTVKFSDILSACIELPIVLEDSNQT